MSFCFAQHILQTQLFSATRSISSCLSVSASKTAERVCLGTRPGLQPAHDPVRYSQDEGVPGGSRDAHGSDVPHRQGLPELPRPAPHLAADHGGKTQRGQLSALTHGRASVRGSLFVGVI